MGDVFTRVWELKDHSDVVEISGKTLNEIKIVEKKVCRNLKLDRTTGCVAYYINEVRVGKQEFYDYIPRITAD